MVNVKCECVPQCIKKMQGKESIMLMLLNVQHIQILNINHLFSFLPSQKMLNNHIHRCEMLLASLSAVILSIITIT